MYFWSAKGASIFETFCDLMFIISLHIGSSFFRLIVCNPCPQQIYEPPPLHKKEWNDQFHILWQNEGPDYRLDPNTRSYFDRTRCAQRSQERNGRCLEVRNRRPEATS